MEELIKAKDEQIAKLNDLKELLKKQILSLQEENTKLKNELFEIEEKLNQLPKESAQEPDYQSMFNSINVKLSTIVEKLDLISVDGLMSSVSTILKSSSSSQAINESKSIKIESHTAEKGLIKPSSLFSDVETDPKMLSKEPQLYREPPQQEKSSKTNDLESSGSFNAADPRSLQRQVLEIEYPENGVIQCPKCGKMEFQEMPDPGRGSFAKKYYCKKCRVEWRFQY